MSKWVRRVRGALGLGLIWAGGAVGVAGVIELLDNIAPFTHPFTRLVDMWPQVMAILGFLAGFLFSIVVSIAGGRRRFHELSQAQFATWGAIAGLLVGVFVLAMGAPLFFLAFAIVGSVIAASATLALARVAEHRGLLRAKGAGADANQLDDEQQELLPPPR